MIKKFNMTWNEWMIERICVEWISYFIELFENHELSHPVVSIIFISEFLLYMYNLRTTVEKLK